MSFSNFNLQKRVENYEISNMFNAYSRVDIVMGEDEEGNVLTVSYPNIPDEQVSGRIMTVEIPMCTDSTLALAAATRIYNSLTSKNPTAFQYQPMQAINALADPSIEFGDSVDINGVHSGFYVREVNFGRLMKTNLSAPADEEIDHEYPYQTPEQRQITRSNKEFKSGLYVNAQAISAEVSERTAQGEYFSSQLQIQATQIAAKVSATGGNNSTFGWVLNASGHTWYAGSKQVMKVNSSGLEVTGKITATSGKIGNFNIGSKAIWNNISQFNGTQSSGVYLGTDGIQLGQRFKVDTSGNVTATRLTVDTLIIGGQSVSAATLNNRANSAYTSTSAGGYCYTGATNGTNAYKQINDSERGGIWVNSIVFKNRGISLYPVRGADGGIVNALCSNY